MRYIPTTYRYTRAELVRAGLVVNQNMWLGSGWFYCPNCKAYRYHEALSHPGRADCFEVCRECHAYTGNHPVAALELVTR